MTISECTYWNKCPQKKTYLCNHNYESCTIYQKMKVLDPNEGYFIGAVHLEDIIRGKEDDTQ